MVYFDTLSMEIRVNRLHRDPACPMCGEHPTITKLIDYEEFCGLRTAQPTPGASAHAAA
jgi:adenylyltransferase/sulfurtransferase